jgi:membrane-associated phospholipid phosphatase
MITVGYFGFALYLTGLNMFQIEPVLWLQSFESPGLTWLMTTISWLGYTPVYATLLIVLIFGFRLKQGLFIFLALVINGILTDGLKRGFAFPRPSDVDIRVIEPGYERPPLLIDGGAAKSFWELPSSEARAATKIQTDWSYGFPSGHVSSATVFLLALAFFFRSRSVFLFALGWILLMALSRMYLGRHFIADILGGMGVGVFAVVVAAFLVRPLHNEDSKGTKGLVLLRWTVFVIPLVVLAPFVDLLDKEDIGRVLGLLVTYALLLRIGFPSDKAKVWKRSARVLLAVLLFIVIDRLVNPLIDSIGLEDNSLGMLAAVFLTTFIPFAAIVLIARRLKIYERI